MGEHRICTTCGEYPLIQLIVEPGTLRVYPKISCDCASMCGEDVDELWKAWDSATPFSPREVAAAAAERKDKKGGE